MDVVLHQDGKNPQAADRWVRRLAFLTCAVSLLPISIGSLVTTLQAGMAFADWPSSDGQNMLLYPWLNDLRHTDKFVEHGHRLAGVLIGVVAIILCSACFIRSKSRVDRRFGVIILISVIAQGLLGGARVLMNASTLAMVHSLTAALFFSLCMMFATTQTKAWQQVRHDRDRSLTPVTLAVIVFLPLLVLGQYFLGGAYRHLGTMLHEHVAGAICVGLMCSAAVGILLRTEVRHLHSCGWLVLSVLVLQLLLGAGSWVTKLGLQSTGFVATRGGWLQSLICSAHTIGGMLLLFSSIRASAFVMRLWSVGGLAGMSAESWLQELPASGESTSRAITSEVPGRAGV